MADELSPHDSELTPEQEAAVRRLLADARHDEAIPEDVAARLDRVLVKLRDEPAAAGAPVVELAARRRRRNAGRLLMAAAAIVLGGVAVGQFVETSGSGDSGSDSPSSTAEDLSARTSQVSPDDSGGAELDSSQPAQEAAPGAAAPDDDRLGFLDRELPVQLYQESFDEDVRNLAGTRRDALAELAADAEEHRNLLRSVRGFDCPPGAYGRGTLVPAYYEDQPAVLAFRPPLGSNQVAELLRCGTAERLRSVELKTKAPN